MTYTQLETIAHLAQADRRSRIGENAVTARIGVNGDKKAWGDFTKSLQED